MRLNISDTKFAAILAGFGTIILAIATITYYTRIAGSMRKPPPKGALL
jgi:hypothetical protein